MISLLWLVLLAGAAFLAYQLGRRRGYEDARDEDVYAISCLMEPRTGGMLKPIPWDDKEGT